MYVTFFIKHCIMTKYLLFFTFLLTPLVVLAQKSVSKVPAPHEHFSKQLLKLEKELDELRELLDEEERRVRLMINKKVQRIYALKQEQRSAENPTVEERNRIGKEIETISKSVQEDRVKLIAAISDVEKKRKAIFSLKMNIDEWITKIEATEVSVIERIEKIESKIHETIKKLQSEFKE